MHSRSGNGVAYLAALSYAAILGFSFLFVKLTVTEASPLDVIAHRFALSLIALTIPVLLGWIKINIKLRDMLRILPLALLSPLLFFPLQAFGLMSTSSSEGGIIQATVPIFTLLLASYFLKERTTVLQKISLLLSVFGVVFIFVMKSGAPLASNSFGGIFLLVLSAICLSGYNVLARPLTQKYSPMELTYVTSILGCIVFNLAALGYHAIDGSMSAYTAPLVKPDYWMALAYLGILSTLATSLLSSFALKWIEASKMSVIGNLSTLISMLAGAYILKEQLAYYHIIGAVVIIIGVVGTNFGGRKSFTPIKTTSAKSQ
ncbi:DMT family transporter [Paenibacillus polymyxa]|uniref:DMT family transporter n=1 Tax=Paenibacillus polymyxa TaxID=1406 RepID=UPI00058A50A8|nr:DMT family transporter [Paenibacillus polymyxa]AJE50996.1 transporter [Paenibacillus polymyxa]QOH60614.1 EamA family transporter [Paenibacillus polymyxa]